MWIPSNICTHLTLHSSPWINGFRNFLQYCLNKCGNLHSMMLSCAIKKNALISTRKTLVNTETILARMMNSQNRSIFSISISDSIHHSRWVLISISMHFNLIPLNSVLYSIAFSLDCTRLLLPIRRRMFSVLLSMCQYQYLEMVTCAG